MRTVFCVLLALPACASDDDPFALRRDENAWVDPGTAYRACERDQDCVLVDVTCNGCCERSAIAATQVERFDVEKAAACGEFHGWMCDCGFAKIEPACVAQRCSELPE